MKKRVVSLLLASAMAVTAFTGCGGGGGSSSAEASKPASEAPGSEASGGTSQAGSDSAEAQGGSGEWSREFEGTSLSFLDVAPSDVRTSYYEGIFEKFYKDTGIEVEYQSVPWDDAANKLTVLGASGTLPDVMTTWNGWLGQFTQSGWVIPLDDYIGDTVSDYTDAVVNILWESEKTRYNHIYTVPDGLMAKGIYVRKDWCDELGIKLDPTKSWTYDEYFDLVEKLTVSRR